MLIRVPIVIVGIREPVWDMDGMKHQCTGIEDAQAKLHFR
jgi:hypothetical protein